MRLCQEPEAGNEERHGFEGGHQLLLADHVSVRILHLLIEEKPGRQDGNRPTASTGGRLMPEFQVSGDRSA